MSEDDVAARIRARRDAALEEARRLDEWLRTYEEFSGAPPAAGQAPVRRSAVIHGAVPTSTPPGERPRRGRPPAKRGAGAAAGGDRRGSPAERAAARRAPPPPPEPPGRIERTAALAREILAQAGGVAMTTRELHDAMARRGFRVGGEDSVAVLAARLGRAGGGLYNTRGVGWRLRGAVDGPGAGGASLDGPQTLGPPGPGEAAGPAGAEAES